MSSSRTCGCDSQLINYLQSQAPRHALFVSSSMAQTQDPAIDQVQSQAEHFPHSPAPGPRSCSRSGSYSIRGTAGGGFCREQLPAPGGSVHLPAQLSPPWLPSYRVSLCSERRNQAPSPDRSMLSGILRQTERKRPRVPGSVQKNPFPPDTASALLESLCRGILALK